MRSATTNAAAQAERRMSRLGSTPPQPLEGRRRWLGGRPLAALFALTLSLSATMPLRGQEPPEPESSDLALPYSLRVEDPTRDRVFRAESEDALLARLRKEYPKIADQINVPKTEPSKEPFRVRAWVPQAAAVEPNVVCYRPLYFEDKNTERYGWDFSIFQPIVSTGKFYLDLVTLPYQMGAHPPCCCECNTGYFLPGDPAPYLLYVPPPSLAGAAAQTAVMVGGAAIFP